MPVFKNETNNTWYVMARYMTLSGAEAQGLERASKNPKCTRFGRQNPISERWNSEEQLLIWRKAWADVVNKEMESWHLSERIGTCNRITAQREWITAAMRTEGWTNNRPFMKALRPERWRKKA